MYYTAHSRYIFNYYFYVKIVYYFFRYTLDHSRVSTCNTTGQDDTTLETSKVDRNFSVLTTVTECNIYDNEQQCTEESQIVSNVSKDDLVVLQDVTNNEITGDKINLLTTKYAFDSTKKVVFEQHNDESILNQSQILIKNIGIGSPERNELSYDEKEQLITLNDKSFRGSGSFKIPSNKNVDKINVVFLETNSCVMDDSNPIVSSISPVIPYLKSLVIDDKSIMEINGKPSFPTDEMESTVVLDSARNETVNDALIETHGDVSTEPHDQAVNEVLTTTVNTLLIDTDDEVSTAPYYKTVNEAAIGTDREISTEAGYKAMKEASSKTDDEVSTTPYYKTVNEAAIGTDREISTVAGYEAMKEASSDTDREISTDAGYKAMKEASSDTDRETSTEAGYKAMNEGSSDTDVELSTPPYYKTVNEATIGIDREISTEAGYQTVNETAIGTDREISTTPYYKTVSEAVNVATIGTDREISTEVGYKAMKEASSETDVELSTTPYYKTVNEAAIGTDREISTAAGYKAMKEASSDTDVELSTPPYYKTVNEAAIGRDREISTEAGYKAMNEASSDTNREISTEACYKTMSEGDLLTPEDMSTVEEMNKLNNDIPSCGESMHCMAFNRTEHIMTVKEEIRKNTISEDVAEGDVRVSIDAKSNTECESTCRLYTDASIVTEQYTNNLRCAQSDMDHGISFTVTDSLECGDVNRQLKACVHVEESHCNDGTFKVRNMVEY